MPKIVKLKLRSAALREVLAHQVKVRPKKLPMTSINKVDGSTKALVLKRLWAKEAKIKSTVGFSEQRKRIEALADHLSGESLKDAALRWGISPFKLAAYKAKFFRADNQLPQFLEDCFNNAAKRALGVFEDKAEKMNAFQAINAAAVASDQAIKLQKARKTDYSADDAIPLQTMQKIAGVLDKIAAVRQGKVIEVIDVPSEAKLLEDS